MLIDVIYHLNIESYVVVCSRMWLYMLGWLVVCGDILKCIFGYWIIFNGIITIMGIYLLYFVYALFSKFIMGRLNLREVFYGFRAKTRSEYCSSLFTGYCCKFLLLYAFVCVSYRSGLY